MRGLYIGVGAAGNKSIIKDIEDKVISTEDALLINSTDVDVPEEYRKACIIMPGPNGCGKEREIGEKMALDWLKDNGKDLLTQKILSSKSSTEPYKFVCFKSSVDGGTGSGAVPILSKYCSSVIKMPTRVIGYVGFNEDLRELKNIFKFAKAIDPSITVTLIKNSAFMKDSNSSKAKAKELANEQGQKIIKIINGSLIKSSRDNMDETDLFKSIISPGYQYVDMIEIKEKIKSAREWNDLLQKLVDNCKYMMADKPNQQRLGIIINMKNETSFDYVDDKSVLYNAFGDLAYECFEHRQSEKDMPEFVAVISSGLRMPKEEIEDINARYLDLYNKKNREEDDFFSSVLNDADGDDAYNLHSSAVNSGDEDDFFKSFEK